MKRITRSKVATAIAIALVLSTAVVGIPLAASGAVPSVDGSPSAPPTDTPTVTPSDTPTVTPSDTPTVTPSVTPTVTPSITPSASPTVTLPAPYTANLPTVDITVTDPNVTIGAVNADPQHNTRAQATISISDPTGAYNLAPQTGGEIKGRGNYTWTLAKKPYQIKLPSSTSVLGIPAAKTWVLLANQTDVSLMRNKVAYDFANTIGMPYSSESRFVDLRINGQYQGSYLLTEKVEVKKNRVDLSDKQAVIAELDNNYGTAEDYYFRSSTTGTIFTLKDAKSDVPDKATGPLPADTAAGWADMQNSLNALDAALAAPSPDWNKISSLIDVDSFVRYYFVYEVTENPEVVASSVYFYKNGPADKIHAGPVWDFDSALFNYDKHESFGADVLSDFVKNGAALRGPTRAQASNAWYQDIFRSPQFVQRANQMWQDGIGAAALALPSKIDEYQATVTASAANNFKMWKLLGQPTQLIAGEGKTYASSYAGEVSYLRGKVSDRVAFLNKEYGQVPILQYRSQVQNIGWMNNVDSGQFSGTTGRSLRDEAVSLAIVDNAGVSGSVQAMSHVQNIGWSGWGSSSQFGTVGRGLRLEAFRLQLTGDLASRYDISYRAHVQNIGWQSWVSNGAIAGTTGQALRIESVQIRLIAKNGAAPSPTATPTSSPSATPTGSPSATPTSSPSATPTSSPSPTPATASAAYSAHVQNVGWMPTVKDGATAGTIGRSLRIEALMLAVSSSSDAGGIEWRGQVQNVGWQNWTAGNQIGTTGQSLRLESFQLKLTGDLAQHFSVRYRAYVQNIGWQGWVSDGQTAGTVGQSLRMEAVQIEMVPKA